ncbi:unnamed protein product [Ilex paraguariensis]|uniref:Uncharacterized protein n=1 Tax=Ilex paraguariensis TaxID=185542 RepID=A0ABC8RCA7_9AQUA
MKIHSQSPFLAVLGTSVDPFKTLSQHITGVKGMDEDRIGLILARASELRSKITNCIHKAPALESDHFTTKEEREGEEEEEEAESLLNIRDALESLEAQLSSLQVCSFFLTFFSLFV